MTRHPVRVLVVDDSALVREAMTRILSRDPDISVTTAANPVIALSRMRIERPDVIVLDLEMPQMHGLVFLERLMADDPLPVVVCSEHVPQGSERALRALELGAVDILRKPRLNLQSFFADAAVTIADAVRAAAAARIKPNKAPRRPVPARPAPASAPRRALPPSETIVAIGASTGGTEAIYTVLNAMPADGPGVVVVQHMPEGFTAAFAQRLDSLCAVQVKEAADGDEVLRGRALIAAGNQHMLVHRRAGRFRVEVSTGPLVSRHRPSVDVLFRSVAAAAAAAAVGVIMTGMGDDGAEGLGEMRRAGAHTIAQSAETCVVFGMPAVAIQRGAVDEIVPLSAIPAAIVRSCRR